MSSLEAMSLAKAFDLSNIVTPHDFIQHAHTFLLDIMMPWALQRPVDSVWGGPTTWVWTRQAWA